MAGGKRCETCCGYGHNFRECENECVYCGQRHKGICPVCPERYPKASEDARARSIELMCERTAREKQRLEQLHRQLADADYLERRVQDIRDDVERSAGGPLPKLPAGKNAALMAMGKDATWRDIHPGWREVHEQATLKAQWNAEALGEQRFAENSMLMAALIRFNRWPVQRDANGFPIEE